MLLEFPRAADKYPAVIVRWETLDTKVEEAEGQVGLSLASRD